MICYSFEDGQGNLAGALPELIVLEGMRHILTGYATGQIQPWECLRMTCEDLLGPRSSRVILAEMSNWVRTMSQYKTGGIQFAEMGAPVLTADEKLALALVSAAQNGDEFSCRHAARQLAGQKGELAVMLASHDFARSLRDAGHRLSPLAAPDAAALLLDKAFQFQGNSQIH